MNVKFIFEELTTLLTQIEAVLNSRPLVPLPSDDDGIEALTPGHFLIGRPLESIPDPSSSYGSLSILRRWHLVQALVRHFWKRWSREYLVTLRKRNKWHSRHRNVCIGDIVVVEEDNLIPSKWPLAQVTQVHVGPDGVIQVVVIKTAQGAYTRPVNKAVVLLPMNEH